jgi:hypothetical protein
MVVLGESECDCGGGVCSGCVKRRLLWENEKREAGYVVVDVAGERQDETEIGGLIYGGLCLSSYSLALFFLLSDFETER